MLMESSSWATVSSQPHVSSESYFWQALHVWNKSPNLVNKRVFGVKLYDFKGHDHLNLIVEILKDTYKLNKSTDICKYLDDKLQFSINNEEGRSEDVYRYRIFSKIILYKREQPDSLEVAIFDNEEKCVVFLEPGTETKYCVEYKENEIRLKIPLDKSCRKDVDWHAKILLPKLVKWMENYSTQHNPSISLVSIDLYRSLYLFLKKKYTSDIKQIWTEVTDPDKFIHEDIAIATYILLLWKDQPPRRFVDLGCGNGLLVHILNGEGHLGIGYDLRARKIWSKYPHTTVLKVMQIKPSKEQIFPEADWIIGNHSDELTPWIPVISTFSSPHTNFFLLPCCAYDFDGTKFRRSDTRKSLYNDYLDYVERISVCCGFRVTRDRLRIPSTKRICFVTSGRNHDTDYMDRVEQSIDAFIQNSTDTQSKLDQTTSWHIQVKLRPPQQKVTNCTQIDQNIKSEIVNLISQILLKDGQDYSDCLWNEGTPVKISDIIERIPSNYLIKLKKEGKGLQTLIKNHHHIFKLEGGLVRFRKPSRAAQIKSENWQTKSCWFFENHPNSCPLNDDQCSYRHQR